MTVTRGAEELADLIFRLRVTRGLTQSELARRCKVAESTVRNWEHARRLPGVEQIRPLARALRTDEDEFAARLAACLVAKRNGHRTHGR